MLGPGEWSCQHEKAFVREGVHETRVVVEGAWGGDPSACPGRPGNVVGLVIAPSFYAAASARARAWRR